MFEKSGFINGEFVLCEQNGKNADMNMTIKVKNLKDGDTLSLGSDTDEIAVLLTEGAVVFGWDGKTEKCERANPFEMKPYAIHISKGNNCTVTALKDTEIVIEQTDNDNVFPTEFYNPENCLYQEFGKTEFEGASSRVVSTMFDKDNSPLSNLVLGEVFNKPGRWSSYPPHHHPQPEVYYYRFDKPQGFGACFNGDEVYKSTDKSFCTVRDGQDHEQVVAPGYNMYYVWMIRHNDGDPWFKTTRIVSDEHKWLDEIKWN